MDVIVYGTGGYGKAFFHQYGDQYNVLFWIDSDEEKQGGRLFDREIKSPLLLKKHIDTPIVVAIRDDKEVRIRLFEVGCSEVLKFDPKNGIYKIDGKVEKIYSNTVCKYWNSSHELLDFEAPYSCTSQLCNQSFFDAPFFQYWAMRYMPNFLDHLKMNTFMQTTDITFKEPIIYHRKLWEWVYVSQAFYEREFLMKGKKGVAFGVGEECTPD